MAVTRRQQVSCRRRPLDTEAVRTDDDQGPAVTPATRPWTDDLRARLDALLDEQVLAARGES
jgi:hypothetical protein